MCLARGAGSRALACARAEDCAIGPQACVASVYSDEGLASGRADRDYPWQRRGSVGLARAEISRCEFVDLDQSSRASASGDKPSHLAAIKEDRSFLRTGPGERTRVGPGEAISEGMRTERVERFAQGLLFGRWFNSHGGGAETFL